MCQSQGLYIKCIILCSHGKNLTDFSVTLMKSSFYDAVISAMFKILGTIGLPICSHTKFK